MSRKKLSQKNAITTALETAYIHVAQGSNSYKITKANFQKALVSGFIGSVAAADAVVTEDGIYICEDSGTYTNNGVLVVDLTSTLSFIAVTDTQTVFNLIEIPIDTTGLNRYINVLDYGAIGDGVTDDTADIALALDEFSSGADDDGNNAALKAQKTVLFPSGYVFLISSSYVFTSLNGINIMAHGATILFDIDGEGFDFQLCNYPKIHGGNWIVRQDTTDACAFSFTRTKFADFQDMEIAGNGSGNDSNNTGIKLLSVADGINDGTNYNTFKNIRINRLGLAIEASDELTTGASRVLMNQFKQMEIHCAAGLKYEAAVNNYFDGVIETNSGLHIELTANTNSIGSSENGFDLKYIAGTGTVEVDSDCRANVFTDYHSTNSQNTGNLHGGSHVAGLGYVDVIDYNLGGIRRDMPSVNESTNLGGVGGTNLIGYSNDFSQWTATDCTIAANTGLTDPDGNYSPNGGGSDITSTSSNGDIMFETPNYALGNILRNNQYTGRVWMHSTTAITSKLEMRQWTGSATRTLWQKDIYLPANVWVLAMIGAKATGSGSQDRWRFTIYPIKNGTGTVTLYEAGVYKGYARGHLKTDDSDEPRQAYGVVGNELISNGGLYLGGETNSNLKTMVTASATMPSSGSWVLGDEVINSNPSETGSPAYIIRGWKRLTTGSANVLNTDWFEMRTLTGN